MENQYCKYNVKNWLQDNEMSEEQRKEMFPGLVTKDECTNIIGKLATSGNYDQVTYDNQVQSYINETGYPCLYYPYLFQEDKMQEFTGEHSGAGYAKPFQIIISMEIKDAPSWVTGLGVQNDQTVTAWIHIRTFKNKIYPILDNGQDERWVDYNSIYVRNPWKVIDQDPTRTDVWMKKIMPKPKDCFQMLTSACDREWDAGARIWEITNVEDEIFSQKFNMSQGHYIWKITAKRYRYSFEYGMSTLDSKSADNPMLGQMGEKGNHQVYENDIVKMYMTAVELYKEDFVTKIVTEQGEIPIIDDGDSIHEVHYKKKYSQKQVCDDSKKQVFDMSKNKSDFYEHLDSGGFF